MGKKDDLVNMLPNKKFFFEKIEKDRNRLIFNLLNLIIYRNINGNYLRLPRETHQFIDIVVKEFKSLRNKMLTNDEKELIKNTIVKKLNILSPTELNTLIRIMNNSYQKKKLNN